MDEMPFKGWSNCIVSASVRQCVIIVLLLSIGVSALAGESGAQALSRAEVFVENLISGEVDPVTANYAILKYSEHGRDAARERIGRWIRMELCGVAETGACSRPTRAPSCEWQAINLGWGVANDSPNLNAYTYAHQFAMHWFEQQKVELSQEISAAAQSDDAAQWVTELEERRLRDQWWRQPIQVEDDGLPLQLVRLVARIQRCDSGLSNVLFARSLVEEYGWPIISEHGERADENLWLLVQHANLGLQREVLVILETLFESGETNPRNYAMLYDRVAHRSGQPQRYGSQYSCSNGRWELYETEDLDEVDQRREAMGMNSVAENGAGILGSVCGD